MAEDLGARKICLLGDFSVGKTSLIRQYVHQIFNDRYLTTVGVRIDTMDIEFEDRAKMRLVIWDMEGKEQLEVIDEVYTRGASGFIIVVDGTRAYTVKTARNLMRNLKAIHGPIPTVVLINKFDLIDEFEIELRERSTLAKAGHPIIETSAKTGLNVEKGFQTLAQQLRAEP